MDFNPWFILGGAGLGLLEYPQQMKNYRQQLAYNQALESWSPWTGRHGQFVQQPSLFHDVLQGAGAGAAMTHLTMGGSGGASSGSDGQDGSDGSDGSDGADGGGDNTADDGGLKKAAADAAASDSTPPDQPAHVSAVSPAPGPAVTPSDPAPSTAAPGGPTHIYSQGAVGGGQVPPNPNYYAQPPMANAAPNQALPAVQQSELFNPYQNTYSPGAVGGYTVPYSPDYLQQHPELQYPGPYIGRTQLRG